MTDRLNLIETIAKEDKFSTFSRLLGTSGAIAAFSQEGPFTVFVPTNDAFGKIPDAKMNELLNEPNQPQLKALLSYHIMHGKVMAANIPAMITRKSVTDEDIAFSDSAGLKVNGAGIQARNIEATNGVIHQVDTVLAPPPKATAAVAAAVANATTDPLSTAMPVTPMPITPEVKASEAVTIPQAPTPTIAVAPKMPSATQAAAPSRTPEKPIF